MPEKFNPKNTNDTLDQEIDAFRKSEKGLGEMDDSLATMRNSEHYDEFQAEQEKQKEMENMGDGAVSDFKGLSQETKTSKKEEKDDAIKKEKPAEKKATAEEGSTETRKETEKLEEMKKQREKYGKSEYENVETREESSKTEKGENISELQQAAEKSFQEYLKSEEALQKAQKNRGKLNKITLGLFGKEKEIEGKKSNVYEEYKKAEENLKKSKKAYRDKFQEFSNKLVKDKKKELKNREDGETALKDHLNSFILSEKVISRKEKQKDGSEQEKEFTLLEYMNENEKKLLETRTENLSEKKRGNLMKMMEWRNKLPKTKKFVLDVAVSATIGATIGLAGGAGLAGAATYFGYEKLGKIATRKILTMAGVAGVVGATKKALDYDKKIVQQRSGEKRDSEFTESFESEGADIFAALDQYNETIKKKELKNKGLMMATGATAVAFLGSEFSDAWGSGSDLQETRVSPSELPEVEDSAMSDATSTGPTIEKTGISEATSTGPTIEKSEISGASVERMGGDQEIYPGARTEPHSPLTGRLAEMAENNQDFKLEKGGNVWNSLENHFGGDQQEVGKVLADFKKETVVDLVDNHGMTPEQANQYIDWRYRHMDVGADFQLKDGKLEIPGFNSEQKMTQFGKTEFNDVVGDDTVMNAGESRAERVSDLNSNENPLQEGAVETEVEAPVNPEIEKAKMTNIKQIYNEGSFWKDQMHEWDVMKEKEALDILKGEFGNPIENVNGRGVEVDPSAQVAERGDVPNNPLDGAEITNRNELRRYLGQLIGDSGIAPEKHETVEEFIERAEGMKLAS